MLKYRRWSGSYEKNRTGIYYRHGIYRCVAGRAVSHGRGRRADGCYRQPCPAGGGQRKPLHLPHPPRKIITKNTTGAQLISLNDSYGVTTVNGVTKTPIGISAWKLEGISKEDAIIYPYSSSTFLGLSKGDYVFSVFGTSKAKARYTIVGRGSSGYIPTGYSQKISIQEDVKLTFNLLIQNGVKSDGILMIMLNSGSTSLPWEPYTGGDPSPSPEYPQEIESTGQSGEIGVTVTGTNLLPFEVGQKGNGFEVFADGVQVDVDRKTDIYAVGRNNGNVESGYDEFALMTAGKYYIYSGTQDVYLYVVVWRKGKNVVLGHSVGTDAEQIEIMDGDKFRIFLRTTAAFKGKVKAMITRTPMNATSYEPYKPAQTLIIPTPNGLPGIPVSSDGNYTDADGRQWVCDEVDFKKGVYVQRIGKRTITSKDVFHKSGMSTDDVNYFSLGNFSLHIGTIGEKDVLMSNCFVAGINHGFGAWGKIFLSSAFDGKVYFSVEAQKYPDEETFKQWAVENGLMFLYQLVDIIETPLAAEELSAYKTLRTYSPTTTVINDAGAGMSVGYKRRK
ncbi:hypothetical protein [Gallintestinimicrobium sp.]|uniref:hypothetical protein n=1 Tax=Gallintestinimicrobium sp. TaxID=2981655 RepID=UPI00399A36D4